MIIASSVRAETLSDSPPSLHFPILHLDESFFFLIYFITIDCCTTDSASRVSDVQTPPGPMAQQHLCINTFPLPMRWWNEGGRPPTLQSEEEARVPPAAATTGLRL